MLYDLVKHKKVLNQCNRILNFVTNNSKLLCISEWICAICYRDSA